MAARRPGAAARGALRDSALVLEEDPGLWAPGVFFTAGHRSATHCWTASSRRSRARRAGRCKVQCIAPKTFQTWPGWYRTPVSRSITAATRGSVHRSVPKPWARAPWRKARSTCCSWGRSSLGLRPARPAPRSAAMPPFRHCRYQRVTLWRLTWTDRATEARIAPARNNFAACRRRSSKAWKSRRGRTDGFMRPVYTKCWELSLYFARFSKSFKTRLILSTYVIKVLRIRIGSILERAPVQPKGARLGSLRSRYCLRSIGNPVQSGPAWLNQCPKPVRLPVVKISWAKKIRVCTGQ